MRTRLAGQTAGSVRSVTVASDLPRRCRGGSVLGRTAGRRRTRHVVVLRASILGVDRLRLGFDSARSTSTGGQGLRFEHRDTETDASIVDRAWRTCSDTSDTMTSAARTSCQLILTRVRGHLLAILRGPETTATTAPVPPDAEFLGIRFALGAVLRPHPAASIVDGYVPLPVTGSDRIVIGGEDWEAPTYENAEHFVR